MNARRIVAALCGILLVASHVNAQQPAPFDVDRVSKTVTVGDLSFPVVDAGSGSVVLLLHGFPDSRHLWRHQIGALVDAGFRVVAPDLRGFGDAPKPAAVDAYALPTIAGDVIGILDALGIRSVRVVGHDWGSAVAWFMAGAYPQRVERLVALSVGAPGNSGTQTIEQREKSWYFLFFQFEGIAEASLTANDWRLFKQWTRGQGDADRYLKDLARPGALTSALNWYRANVRPRMPPSSAPVPPPSIACPAMGIWGDQDPFLTEQHVARSVERMSGPWTYKKVEGAGHWIMLDKPDELNRLLLEFLKG